MCRANSGLGSDWPCFYGRLSFTMKTHLLMLFVIGVILISSHTACACSCGLPSVKEAFTKSKAVFSGTVLAIESDGVRFKVNQSWKGSTATEIKVHVRMLGTSCDPGVHLGRTLLVYGYPGSPRVPLVAGYCSRTRALAEPDDETKELDALRSSAQVRRPTNRWTARRLVRLDHSRLIKPQSTQRASQRDAEFESFLSVLCENLRDLCVQISSA